MARYLHLLPAAEVGYIWCLVASNFSCNSFKVADISNLGLFLQPALLYPSAIAGRIKLFKNRSDLHTLSYGVANLNK